MMICFWENTFWAKTSLSFVFRGWNLVYPEVLRCDDDNGTSFKAVRWSVSEKALFGLKHHFPLYLEGQTQWTLRLSGHAMFTMLQVSKLYDDLFLKTTHLGLKDHFSLYLKGQTQCTLRFSGVMITMAQVSKLYDDLFLRKHFLG